MTEKMTIQIGGSAKVETWRDGEWTILYVEDGSGAGTTVSLNVGNALSIAELLRGSAITASARPQR
jgi:hypothetical protein